MQSNEYPSAPQQNTRIKEGIYEAVIKEVENRTYGDHDSPMVRIVFEIPAMKIFFVSHIYFPGNNSIGAKRRLWHFCCCVHLDPSDVMNNPEAFLDRWLRIHVMEFVPESYPSYCDVHAFFPSQPALEEPEGPDGWELDCDWVKPLRSDPLKDVGPGVVSSG